MTFKSIHRNQLLTILDAGLALIPYSTTFCSKSLKQHAVYRVTTVHQKILLPIFSISDLIHNLRERKVKTFTKNWRGHTHTRKQNRNILVDMAVFFKEKRANVCEHMRKMASSLSCAHMHLLSFDWERWPILFPCVCLCTCPSWSLQFLVRVFTFLSLILCYSYFGTSLSMWSV
jgi:hypothetical protein